MTDNEIREAIAEDCGVKPEFEEWWAHKEDDTGGRICMSSPTKEQVEKWIKENPKFAAGYAPKAFYRYPRYTECLNACAEFERTLEECDEVNGEDQLGYMEMLAEVVGAKWGANNQCDMWRITHATAPQRCEAFLRVKGLWRD